MICCVYDFGIQPYQAAWDLQNQWAVEISRRERYESLVLLQHPHTYTIGRMGKIENVLWSEDELIERGVSLIHSDRGGDVTYHGPGQLVGYPLIKLGNLDHVGYVRNLEKVLINALAGFGLACGQIRGKTGVWVQADVASRCPRCRPEDKKKPAKIAAIGVKVDANGITRHGFALNLDPDMSYFDGIVPCGIRDYPVISLADIFPIIPSNEMVIDAVVKSFGDIFGYEMILK